MKTVYKYVRFEKQGKHWLCLNKKDEYQFGVLIYNSRWKEWEFCPDPDMAFTIECLKDLADFIDHLN